MPTPSLSFYYHPVSINARRVWIALLEKQLAFEPMLVDLAGEQLTEEFTKMNPLQRIPVLIDDGLRIVESLAILDYLEAKYPEPRLMPVEPAAIALVRMVEMAAVTELQPATFTLTCQALGLSPTDQAVDYAQQRIMAVLQLYEHLFQQTPYILGEQFSLADIVAGTLVAFLPMFQFSLAEHPRVQQWLDQVSQRDSIQQTTPSPETLNAALPHIREILKARG